RPCTSSFARAAATAPPRRSGRAAPSSSCTRRRTRSLPRSRPSGWARASGSPSRTRSTTWRRWGSCDRRPRHGRRDRDRRGGRAPARRRGLPRLRDRPAPGAARGSRRRGRRARGRGRHERRARGDGAPRDGRRAARAGLGTRLLRRHERGRDGPRADARALAAGARDEPHRRVPRLPRRAAAADRDPRRDRHDRLARRPAGGARVGGVRVLQGRRRDAHAVHGTRPRAAGRPLELRLPRLDPDADGRCRDGRARPEPRRGVRTRQRDEPAPPAGAPRGGGGGGRVAALAAGGLRERRGPRDRRRRRQRRRRLAGVRRVSPAATVAGVAVSPDHFIGGERIAGDERFEVRSPIDESVLAEVARGGAPEVELAVRAAEEAFPAWSALGPSGRAEYLRRLAGLIDENVERLARVECLDMAMLERSLRARVIPRGARNYRSYAELAENHVERAWSSGGTENRVLRMPSGPAAVITPWNAPFMLSTWKTAPALAAGCTVILKPPEWAPLSCSVLADLASEAGFP